MTGMFSVHTHRNTFSKKKKKTLQLPGILEDNVLGRKIVRKRTTKQNKKQKTVGQRSEAWRATVNWAQIARSEIQMGTGN